MCPALSNTFLPKEAGITSPLGTDPTPFSEGGMQQNYTLVEKCDRKSMDFTLSLNSETVVVVVVKAYKKGIFFGCLPNPPKSPPCPVSIVMDFAKPNLATRRQTYQRHLRNSNFSECLDWGGGNL